MRNVTESVSLTIFPLTSFPPFNSLMNADGFILIVCGVSSSFDLEKTRVFVYIFEFFVLLIKIFYKIGVCCFSTKHAVLRTNAKTVLFRNQDNVSECIEMQLVLAILLEIVYLTLNNNHLLTSYIAIKY